MSKISSMWNITDSSQVTIGLSFVAGLLAFCASCLLPVLPTYLVYLSGNALSDTTDTPQRWRLVRLSMFFVTGFITTFVLIGSLLRFLVYSLHEFHQAINIGMATLFIFLGLFVIGIIHPRLFATERKLQLHSIFKKYAWLHAILFGVLFGLGWSPCIGPVLAVILYWSTQVQTQISGILHLLLFGLGLGLPFIIIAALFEQILPVLTKYKKISYYANIVTGALLVIIGIIILVSTFTSFRLPIPQFYPL